MLGGPPVALFLQELLRYPERGDEPSFSNGNIESEMHKVPERPAVRRVIVSFQNLLKVIEVLTAENDINRGGLTFGRDSKNVPVAIIGNCHAALAA